MFSKDEFPTMTFLSKNLCFGYTFIPILYVFYKYKHLLFSCYEKLFEFVNRVGENENSFKYIFEIDISFLHKINTLICKNENWIVRLNIKDLEKNINKIFTHKNNYLVRISCDLLNIDEKIIINIFKSINNQIIFDPTWAGEIDTLKVYLGKLNEIYRIIINEGISNVLFPPNYFNRQALISHPCNVYACSSEYCHSGKSGNPRRFYITEVVNILPKSPYLSNEYILGTIYDKDFSFKTDAINLFINDMKIIYNNIVLMINKKIISIGSLLDNIKLLKNIMVNLTPLTLYLTNKFSSKYFYYYRNKSLTAEHKEIEMDCLKRYLDNFSQLDRIRLSGDEPSLYSQIKELVSFLSEANILIEILSNGKLIYLDKELIKRFDKICLSLDSCDEAINNQNRVDNTAFNLYHNALLYLREIAFKNIQIPILLSKKNLKQFNETLRYIIEENKINKIKVTNIVTDTMEKSLPFLSDTDLSVAYKIVQSIREEYNYTVSIMTSFFPRQLFLFLHNDISFKKSFFINENNDLFWSISEDSYFKIGNIKYNKFIELEEYYKIKKPFRQLFLNLFIMK